MKGPSLGPGGEDITWLQQVAPRGRKASSTRNLKSQTSNLLQNVCNPDNMSQCSQSGCLVQPRVFYGRKMVLNGHCHCI